MTTTNPSAKLQTNRFDLLRLPVVKRMLKSRAFQPTLMFLTLFFFVLAILSGLFGTPVGNRNVAIIFVWIVWWALLIIFMVPFAGRIWCAICPIPGPGEWLQRRAVIRRRQGRPFSLGKRWPRRLRNIWLQNFGFLGVAVFSAVLLTRPSATGVMLLGFLLLGVGLSLIYERRVFCRYICPVGGFIGLYSLASSLELRIMDPQVCRDHTTKDCYIGGADAYGCPWMVFPGSLERNAYCGLCTECLKGCPKDNIAVNLRPFGTDLLLAKGRRLDEAFKALIMLACALLYSAVLLGPWGWLKDWANIVSWRHFLVYAMGFIAVNLVVLPGIFYAVVALARRLGTAGHNPSLKKLFVDYAYALVPMGLMAWIAFSFSFVLVNGSYALPVISDPFGWGWDLFGTQGWPWTPLVPHLVPYLQVPTLLVGLAFSIYVAHRVAGQYARMETEALRGLLPVALFLVGVTTVFLRLYLG